MSIGGDIRRAARRVTWKAFAASAAALVVVSCAVAGLATHSVPTALVVLLSGLTVVFLAGLTLDAIRAPFDRDLGLGGRGGSATAMFGAAATGHGGTDSGGGGGDC
ncbi:hypothetical protein SAMN04489844_3280 [Nocardioides exalbidus]|uniref:Uncharacterized protein n=1 Tax=Nocardioides exalbidus TaxID=402596 RepID=A0A1H4WIB0_9ACTN|nr:hypothetical protein [Nocardioides exalbidus]SEC93079.1 hypothetical protein SAMN04489844_3280 [Nocardioides exalbidus]